MIIGPILSIADRNYGYFFGLIIALFMLSLEKLFGIGQNLDLSIKKLSYRTVGRGLLIAVAIFLVIEICISPFLEIFFGVIDLSSIEEIVKLYKFCYGFS